jgi:hypothetical protein
METHLLAGRNTPKRIFYLVAGTLVAGALLLILVLADAVGVFRDPPLHIEQSNSAVIVHVERLGEYYCPVGRIRIQEYDT